MQYIGCQAAKPRASGRSAMLRTCSSSSGSCSQASLPGCARARTSSSRTSCCATNSRCWPGPPEPDGVLGCAPGTRCSGSWLADGLPMRTRRRGKSDRAGRAAASRCCHEGTQRVQPGANSHSTVESNQHRRVVGRARTSSRFFPTQHPLPGDRTAARKLHHADQCQTGQAGQAT
jgi:hypothetical protein